MKVVFVCSGNRGVTAIVHAQAESLREIGLEVQIFSIIGKGFWGYLQNIPKLRKYLVTTDPDIVHAHYSLCGIVSSFATNKPVITSLMGSDVNQSFFIRWLTRCFVRFLWAKTIVKSLQMKQKLDLDKVLVIPNGVNLSLFKPLDKNQCRLKIGWLPEKKHILFAANSNPQRPEKNLDLAQKAVALLNDHNLEFHIITNIDYKDMPLYLNASDLLLLTSKWEGSPNIVKEAMACNIPVVSTNVGDVSWLFGDEDGYVLTKHVVEVVAENIKLTLSFRQPTNGRERINYLGLDSMQIAGKLNQLYNESLS